MNGKVRFAKDKGMGGSKKGDGLHVECFDECPVNIRAEVHLITQRGRPDNAAATLFGFFCTHELWRVRVRAQPEQSAHLRHDLV